MKKRINPQVLSEFVHGLLNREVKCIEVPQFTLRVNPRNRLISTCYFRKKYRNSYLCKRVILKNSRFQLCQSLPYGYDSAMLERVKARGRE